MNKGYLALWILGFILLILDLGIVVSLLKKGDERRQLIVWKSSTSTFSILVGVLVLDCVSKLITTALNLSFDNYDNNSSPFSLLTVTAIVFFISLRYNKKKLGG